MKRNLLRLTLTTCLATLIGIGAYAQESEKKSEVRIRVEKNIAGKRTVQERVIDTTGMTEEERNEAIAKAEKELTGKDKKGIKIIIEDEVQESTFRDKEGRFEWRSDEDDEVFFDDDNDSQVRVYRFKDGKNPKVIIRKRGFDDNNFDWDSEEWENDFERSMHNLNNRLRYLGDEIPRRIEQNTPIYRWDNQLFGGKSAPVRSVDVYPNRPDSHVLNVRFFAPNEGDVTIKVLDIDGKVVAKEKVNNFKGEYVGQVSLREGSKGTYFVIISQGDDGISKRVILE